MASGGGGNIKVVVRVRPFNSRENERGAKCIVSMKGNQTVLSPPPLDGKSKPVKAALEGSKSFAFDKSYWSFNKKDPEYAGQEDLFVDLGKPLLDNAFQGYNNCIFAYGQTGSGKSYSMMGYGEETGVIPRICRNMFERIDGVQQHDKNTNCTVEVSYLEIYNERVRDLLNPSTKGNLKVREHPSTGPYVEDLAKLAVRSFIEIEHLMDEGNKARTVAATNMNETSSRSHAVFTLTLTQKRHDAETNMDTEKVAKISLVDLAGSERATSTGATGARLKEGAEINRSLSTLGRVIAALADMSTSKAKGKQVPYRDSVLTWLLKDSLGGNSLTAMIAAISPADINFEETLSTLRYADSAKRIKNHAVVNEDPNARMIRELKEELSQLRSKLGTGGAIAEEQYSADTPLEKQIVSITQADGSIKKVSKAEIAEQLSQSEKLYKDLNQTWEEKLTNTEKIHKEREAALEELGISIEKGFVGMTTPKKMPHLVNLSDDPLLAECLVYNLKPGATTVGNVETNSALEDSDEEAHADEDSAEQSSVDIRLNGSKILHDHCTFENVDGVVTVIPKEGAAVMVNGVRIDAPRRLRSGYRVILGDFHIFRFNHPQEAREERAEQGSLLKYSVTADQLDSPSRRPGHERTSSVMSRPMSDIDGEGGSPGTESPAPWRANGRDSDWAFARKEAISSTLGPDQKMSELTDDQLDVLFEDLQRVRAGRRARPESKFFDSPGFDTDTESVASHPVREKYLSNGTLDNFSLDTALTIPSTPQQSEDEERLKQSREEMQEQLDKRKEDYQQKLQTAEEGSVEIEELRTERVKMEASLQAMKEQMQKQLAEQKADFHRQMAQMRAPPKPPQKINGKIELSERDVFLAKQTLDHWRRLRYVAMAATVLKNASTLKEAQVMSHKMERSVLFQFAVMDEGHTFGSSYDLALHGLSAEESDDPDLYETPKPCIATRVIDFDRRVIFLWSIEKLHKRVKSMRQMLSYVDRPEYMQHFSVDNPFGDDCMPEYTRIGDADIPLAAVFECRVQDFTLDVFSPYTCGIAGVVHLSLEPSSAEAPSTTLKFNVVMHSLIGFPEREGSDVHAQMFIPGVSDEGGVSTTALVNGFGEGAVRFESVHGMSLPLSAPREASLRVSIFARVSEMHFDKLLSWDDMRDASSASLESQFKARHVGSRIPEHEYHFDERHDVFVRMELLEINDEGNYRPVEVVQNDTLDQGAYQLQQGLQRRVVLHMTHSAGASLPWRDIDRITVGQIRLLDNNGKLSDMDSNQADVALKFVSTPVIRDNPDGTTYCRIIAHWDTGLHSSALLDRPSSDKYRIQLSLKWQVHSSRINSPVRFSFDFAIQTRPRTWFRQGSLFGQLFNNKRVVHSTAASYAVTLKPSAAKRAGDLWRMDTTSEYVSGEEVLSSWAPRGISLVRDFLELRRKKRRIAEIESARGVLSLGVLSPPAESPTPNGDDALSDRHTALLNRFLAAWQTKYTSAETMLLQSDIDPLDQFRTFAPPSTNGDSSSSSKHPPAPIPLAAVVDAHQKTARLGKAGWMLTPDLAGTHWIRTYVELRRPYLHLYNSAGDEINAINLTNARLDAEPSVAALLQRPNRRMEVWAVYGTKSWLFACRNGLDRGEWIWAIDQSYLAVDGADSTGLDSGLQTPL